jgi:hypothetical protein
MLDHPGQRLEQVGKRGPARDHLGQARLVARQLFAALALGDVRHRGQDRRLATPGDRGRGDLDPETGAVLANGLAAVA